MANRLLFRSSVLCSLLHLITMIMYPPPALYGSFIGLALTSSICNHGLTSEFWKWSDRIIMVAGSGITTYVAPTPVIKSSVVLLGLLYGAAKRYDAVQLHLAAHGLLTAINMSILYWIVH